MLKKPVPIKLSDAVRNAISEQLNKQTIQKSSKSSDPNYPVFEVLVGKKVLIYVPNHVVVDENGCEELRMDKPLIHSLQEGKKYSLYRCVSGIVAKDENGNTIYDGSCPLCNGTDVPWDLANARIEQKCRQLNLNPKDKENEQVKSIRSSEFSSRAIKEPNRYYTFPIVTIATVQDDGKTPVKDENGQFILTPMWYHISEAQYNKKWIPCLEGIEDEPSHPGGRFFTLSFVYDTKGKEATKMAAAQNLTVIARNIKNSDKLTAFLDDATKDWTPEKAQETVISNQLFSMEDLQDITDSMLESPEAMLALLRAGSNSSSSNSGFNLQVPEEREALGDGTSNSSNSVVNMDDTDEDVDFE